MVFNATFSTISIISWRSILLVEKIGVRIKTISAKQTVIIATHVNCPAYCRNPSIE